MDFFSGETLQTSVVIIVVLSLIKIVEYLAGKIMMDRSVLTREEIKILEEVHELITAKDQDGMPLFYVPRSWANLQTSILEKMEKITRHQQRTAYMMDTIVTMLDKISEREKR